MLSGGDERPGWAYYGAIALFVGILAFAVLGLVRSSSLAGPAAGSAATRPSPTKTPRPGSILSAGPPPTIRIPPPTPGIATPPPSRTYIHPPPESEPVHSEPSAELRR